MSEFKDTLLPLSTYPDPTPEHVVDKAVALADLIGARISTVVSVLDRQKLAKYYAHGSWLMDVPTLIDETLRRSEQNGQRLLQYFERTAAAHRVLQDEMRENSAATSSSELVMQCARLRDLTFLPILDFIGLDELASEDVIFGSGRPVVLLPAYEGAPSGAPSLERIVIAWDFSRAAARALADALPLLHKAKHVRVVTFRGEKHIPDGQTLKDVDRHLRLHRITAVLEEVDVQRRTIGEAIQGYTSKHKADLLVMGAFAHSRLREFVLGGASRSIINKPPLPVFMSH